MPLHTNGNVLPAQIEVRRYTLRKEVPNYKSGTTGSIFHRYHTIPLEHP
ncbi:MAG: hypothetical protein J5711_06935 [Bacteroidales bacterium]|nr:hypothetical protein [Bacteroidales bacterium]